MKTLEDERYVVIKAYKCTVSEIWRDFFVLACIACTSYPYIQSVPTVMYTIILYCVYVVSLHTECTDCDVHNHPVSPSLLTQPNLPLPILPYNSPSTPIVCTHSSLTYLNSFPHPPAHFPPTPSLLTSFPNPPSSLPSHTLFTFLPHSPSLLPCHTLPPHFLPKSSLLTSPHTLPPSLPCHTVPPHFLPKSSLLTSLPHPPSSLPSHSFPPLTCMASFPN